MIAVLCAGMKLSSFKKQDIVLPQVVLNVVLTDMDLTIQNENDFMGRAGTGCMCPLITRNKFTANFVLYILKQRWDFFSFSAGFMVFLIWSKCYIYSITSNSFCQVRCKNEKFELFQNED